jgi:hypothetical protein
MPAIEAVRRLILGPPFQLSWTSIEALEWLWYDDDEPAQSPCVSA